MKISKLLSVLNKLIRKMKKNKLIIKLKKNKFLLKNSIMKLFIMSKVNYLKKLNNETNIIFFNIYIFTYFNKFILIYIFLFYINFISSKHVL
jgi:hypothetical protein